MLIWLIVAHFVGDVTFQSDYQREQKGKRLYVMASHTITWAGMISLVLFFFGKAALWKWPFLILGHAAIDKWRWNMATYHPDKKWAWQIDQALHYLQIVIVYLT